MWAAGTRRVAPAQNTDEQAKPSHRRSTGRAEACPHTRRVAPSWTQCPALMLDSLTPRVMSAVSYINARVNTSGKKARVAQHRDLKHWLWISSDWDAELGSVSGPVAELSVPLLPRL